MLGAFWLFITVVLVILSLILREVPLFLVALLIFLAGGVGRLWDRYSLNRVDYHRRLSSDRVFFGEEVQLEVEISNRKPLPLPWLQVEDDIPKEVSALKGKISPSYSTTHNLLTNLFSIGWYHRIKRRYPLRCLHRGYFSFGPAIISSGDIFGFFTRQKEIEARDHLMVYPKIVPLEKLGIPSKQPLGATRTRNHIFHDPILTMGVREYQPGDSLKKIHWKSTARSGQIQTKIFEPTTTTDLGIFLDVRTVKPPYWGIVSELMELAIVTSASIANYALAEGYRVGLYINQNRPNSTDLIRIPPSQHTEQLKHILEALAPIQAVEAIPIGKMVANESRNLPWGSTLVVVTAVPTEPLLASLFQMKRVGRKVALIMIGGTESISSNGLITYLVPADVKWDEIETVKLAVK